MGAFGFDGPGIAPPRILRNCIFYLDLLYVWAAWIHMGRIAHGPRSGARLEPERRGAPFVGAEVLSPIFRFSRPRSRHRRRTRVHQPQQGSLQRRRRHCGAHGPPDPERARRAPDRAYAHSALWRRCFRSRPRYLAKKPSAARPSEGQLSVVAGAGFEPAAFRL